MLASVAGSNIVNGLGPLYLDAGGSFTALARDGSGSIRGEVNAAGELTRSFRYSAYGELIDANGGLPSVLGFAGEMGDASGLTYLRARWYDARTGRFLYRDPLLGSGRLPDSLNGFDYAASDPIENADPSGLCTDPGGPGIRYCINAFIPQDSILGFGGDARSAMANGGSYRFQQMITRTLDNQLQIDTRMGTSTLGPLARQAEQGLCGGKQAGATITATCSASDGLLGGLAPWVGYYLQIRETARGGSVQHVFASEWPSLEVWEYADGSAPELLFFNDASARNVLNTSWRDFGLSSGK